MRRRSRPGSPAISTARSASGSRSWREHPRDVLAFRLAHFNNFWLGRPAEMRASVERVQPKWARDLPGYGTILSCHCFSLEECGDYAAAEPSGRAAIEIDPGDLWGTHAVAHIMEMQGRHAEGIAWLDELERQLGGRATICCIICGGTARCFIWSAASSTRCSISTTGASAISAVALTQAQPDLYIDVQNAASMLFRLRTARHRCRRSLERDRRQGRGAHRRLPLGVHAAALDDGARGDRPRDAAAQRMLDAMRAFGAGEGTVRAIVGQVALPICEAVLAHRRGDHARAVAADAAGARRHVPARRQPCAAGRADAALPRQRREGGLRRRRASHT